MDRKLLNEIQKRIDDIHTEATRLMVFANKTYDTATGIRLKKIADTVFNSASAIEGRLAKLQERPSRRGARAGLKRKYS